QRVARRAVRGGFAGEAERGFEAGHGFLAESSTNRTATRRVSGWRTRRKTTMKRALIGLAIVLAAACSKDTTSTTTPPPAPPPPPPTQPPAPPPAPVIAAVGITDSNFVPTVTSIPAGITIEWTNNGTKPHTVTSDAGQFSSGIIAPGAKFQFNFAV